MSLQRQLRIACDIPECPTTGPWVQVDGMAPSAARGEAWRAARDLGWGRDEFGSQCCPTHAPKTRRADRIAQLAAQGLNDTAIGERMGLSRAQVQYHQNTRGIAGQRPGRPSLIGARS